MDSVRLLMVVPLAQTAERGNHLSRSLLAREREHTADYDGGDTENRRHHTTFLRSDLERSDFDIGMALRVWHSAHRDDDDAGNNEKHADPTKWPHEYSANGITYAVELGVPLQGRSVTRRL
jgi:hypothetical protein